jgi:hypothetical protein
VLVYKFTDQNMRTYDGFAWSLGRARKASGNVKYLCTDSWLHAYPDKLTASFMWAAHVHDDYTRFFEAEAGGEILRDKQGLKLGCTRLTLIRELNLPAISLNVRRRVAIRYAKATTGLGKGASWFDWAEKWLAGERPVFTPYVASCSLAEDYAWQSVSKRSPYFSKEAAALAVNAATSLSKCSASLPERIREAVKEEAELRRAGRA